VAGAVLGVGQGEVLAADVQDNGSVFCPNPKMALWSAHPRVFIDVAKTGWRHDRWSRTGSKRDTEREAESGMEPG